MTLPKTFLTVLRALAAGVLGYAVIVALTTLGFVHWLENADLYRGGGALQAKGTLVAVVVAPGEPFLQMSPGGISSPSPEPAMTARARRTVSPAVERLVDLMEERFRVPGTEFRFGMDALIGLVPGIGDLLGMVIGLVVLFEALRLRVPWIVLGRMALNLWIEGLVGSVPLVGDLWDFWFKANRRNLVLLQQHV